MCLCEGGCVRGLNLSLFFFTDNTGEDNKLFTEDKGMFVENIVQYVII